jgi:branched-chain amino acid aminotransferase
MGESERQVYVNGSFVPEREARISIYDSALMFGDMVFEMTRTFRKQPFKLREHLTRLEASIKCVRIPLRMSLEELEEAFQETTEVNAHLFDAQDEIRSLINVTRGPLPIYRHVFDGHLEPTVIIACFPLKWVVAHVAKFYDTGVHAVVPSQRAIPGDLLDPKIKNRSRLHYQMANFETAQVDPEAWALLLDPDGFVAEGTGSNFFLIKDGVVYTPEPRNILCGISRGYVMELVQELGLRGVERNLGLYHVMTSDEAFFTCTPFSIMPATRINGLPIGNGKVGPVTQRLIALWSEHVGVNFVAQAQAYARALGFLPEGPEPAVLVQGQEGHPYVPE